MGASLSLSVRRLIALGVVAVVVVVLGVAQLVLPGIAAQRLRSQLAPFGQVVSVRVSAFPAIKLLWHRADTVEIRMATYRSSAAGLSGKLGQISDVGTLTASAQQVMEGLITLHDATLTKRDDRLQGSATVTEAELRSALPILSSVTPVTSADGRLVLRGTATLFGVSATVDATLAAQDGKLVVAPDVPFGGLATITLFSSPHIRVDGVSAASAPGGFTVRVAGTLR